MRVAPVLYAPADQTPPISYYSDQTTDNSLPHDTTSTCATAAHKKQHLYHDSRISPLIILYSPVNLTHLANPIVKPPVVLEIAAHLFEPFLR
jgi:hypothetical protein